MGENNSGEGEKPNADDKGADATQDESQNDGGDGGEGATGDEKADAGDGVDKGDGDADASGKTDDKDEKPTPNADEAPTTRKRKTDFIDERVNKREQKNKAGAKDNEDGEDVDDVAPEDAEIITKVIRKEMKPLIDRQIEEEDKAEIDNFLASNPEFKPYAEKVRKWAKHPSRQHIPIQSLFYEVAGADLMKIGADRSKRADDEARKGGSGGGSNRARSGGSKSVWDMTAAEFEEHQNAVRSMPRE